MLADAGAAAPRTARRPDRRAGVSANACTARSCGLVGLEPARRALRPPATPSRGSRRAAPGDAARRRRAVCRARYASFGSIQPRRPTSAHVPLPLLRQPGERADPRADVAAALGVVRLGVSSACGKRASRSALPRGTSSTARREAAGSPPTSFSAASRHVAVEGGVLDALRHHRPGRLLEAGDELVVAALLEQRGSRRSSSGGSRAARTAPVGRVDAAGPRLDVGAVDVEARRAAGSSPARVAEPAQPLDLGRERLARLLELRLGGDLREAARARRSPRA